MATRRVVEVSRPSVMVPLKSDQLKMTNPKKRTIDVYIMLAPVSRMLFEIAMGTKKLLANSSCLYFARKWMESSTAIPNVTQNISAVLGLKGIPIYPMMPAVMANGTTLGAREIMIILKFLKSTPIMRAIMMNANRRLILKFFTRKLLPFTKSRVDPVTFTSML